MLNLANLFNPKIEKTEEEKRIEEISKILFESLFKDYLVDESTKRNSKVKLKEEYCLENGGVNHRKLFGYFVKKYGEKTKERKGDLMRTLNKSYWKMLEEKIVNYPNKGILENPIIQF